MFGEYTDPADIRYEREVAKLALILGIPTAISYEVVKVGDRYGSVYELLDAVTFSHLLATDPDKVDWCAEESVRILKKIHETAVPAGKLPDVRQKALSKIDSLEDFLGKDVCLKLRTLIEEVPYSDRMIHGDYHTKNLMLMNDEVLLIDMETLAVGHPVFEFGSMFNAYSGFSELDRGQFNRFQGYDYSLAERLWRRSLEIYFNTDDDAFLKDVVDKARIPGYIRMMNFMIVHDGMNNANDRKLLEHWRTELIDLVGHTDTIVFDQDYGK